MADQEHNREADADRRTVEVSQRVEGRVREEDLEPHAGLRYIARLFKVLAILMLLLLIAEVVIAFTQEGTSAIGTLLVTATRLVVFAAALWAAGDMALMLIESNHDLRATRILLGRINTRLQEPNAGGLSNASDNFPPPLR